MTFLVLLVLDSQETMAVAALFSGFTWLCVNHSKDMRVWIINKKVDVDSRKCIVVVFLVRLHVSFT